MSRSSLAATGAFAATLVFVMLATGPVVAGNDNKASAPDVMAVKFHADWCGSCKTIAPMLSDLKNKRDGEPVLFVTLDLTNQTTTAQAALMASALGIDKVYDKHAPKTGYVLLIDAKTKKVVDKLTKKQTMKQMNAAIGDALK
jgi:thiol-disulfide isomerase/thioredoxin